jgi:hypothetical protein
VILQDYRHKTNTELTFIIPCHHGMKTPGMDEDYEFHGYQIWHYFTYEDCLGVNYENITQAYELLFARWRDADEFKGDGYNGWEPNCDVYFFRVLGGYWGGDSQRTYNRGNLKKNCHRFMAKMIEGVAESASGDDSYFDYVPSEYYAICRLAFYMNLNFETEEFTEYPRKIWDAISKSGHKEEDGYPIEFLQTYGERP